MSEESERYIITSALPYINGVKHLGNLIGSLLPADVYTRYLRLLGKDVIFICGTDDHGTPAELSALEAGKPVDKYVKEMYKVQKKIYEDFGLKFDYFGQTSDKENHEITQEIFLGLYKNGYIKEKSSIQLYSIDDKRYLPDRYVIGTCPNCGYELARGDQCENCTTLMDPENLINPKSAISGSINIEKREVNHLYIDLPKLQPKVEEWVNRQEQWPLTTSSIAKKWLREGLKERAITRNLNWGIKIPLEGYDDLVFYVWFDAPIGYISITKHWLNKIKKPERFDYYWKSPKTKLIQFLGIDNVPFHTVTWPCSIIGADLGYILSYSVKGFQWLTYEKGKFSTSQNRGIFTDSALELYPADYWRYYLLLIAPERQDTDFQWEGFQSAVNNDLNNLLGNLLNRFVTFVQKNYEGKIPKYKIGKSEKDLHKNLQEVMTEYKQTFDQIEFQKPLRALKRFWADCNKYFQDTAPWKAITDDPEQADATIATIGHALRSIALLARPFIPFTSEKLFEALGLPIEELDNIKWDKVDNWKCLINSQIPEFKGNLFQKISQKEINVLKKKYGSAEEVVSSKAKDKKTISKEKKQKQNDKPKQKEEQISQIDYDDFAKLDLISARVLDVKPHPDAEKLLVLTIDDGKRNDRTICAGIAEFYRPEQLKGKNIIIVNNLKPRKLRGIVSEGMLLAVEDEQGVHVLTADKKVNPGLKVH